VALTAARPQASRFRRRGSLHQGRLYADSLANAVEQDAIDDAVLDPIRKALDALAKAEPVLTELLMQAQKHFRK
jgi:hypothetical protein